MTGLQAALLEYFIGLYPLLVLAVIYVYDYDVKLHSGTVGLS